MTQPASREPRSAFDRHVTLDALTKVLAERLPDGAAFLRDDGSKTNVLYGEALAASILHLIPVPEDSSYAINAALAKP